MVTNAEMRTYKGVLQACTPVPHPLSDHNCDFQFQDGDKRSVMIHCHCIEGHLGISAVGFGQTETCVDIKDHT